jgi:hypothetical protein
MAYNLPTIMKNSRWSESYRHYAGEKPGRALARWLNEPAAHADFVTELLADAQLVCYWMDKYESLKELIKAWKQKKLPVSFWTAHGRLNEKLATFTHAPHIDLHDLGTGERLSWMLVTDARPTESLSLPLRCVLQLIDRGAVSRVRRCIYSDCQRWYFARRSDQEFCSSSCRWKAFSESELFKQKRREYMRKNYHIKKLAK